MGVLVCSAPGAGEAAIAALQEPAARRFSGPERPLAPGDTLTPGETFYRLVLGGGGEKRFRVQVPAAGPYVLFTQHHPGEFQLALLGPAGPIAPMAAREYAPSHEHDDAVGSIAIVEPGDVHPARLNAWLRDLLLEKGPDIFRMKGILSIRGEDRRFVFQGVHMLFDGRPDRPWQGEQRVNQLVFIGRNLDREALTKGFRACLA